jgi:hypothetical protein
MCTVLLPPGVNPTTVKNKLIIRMIIIEHTSLKSGLNCPLEPITVCKRDRKEALLPNFTNDHFRFTLQLLPSNQCSVFNCQKITTITSKYFSVQLTASFEGSLASSACPSDNSGTYKDDDGFGAFLA